MNEKWEISKIKTVVLELGTDFFNKNTIKETIEFIELMKQKNIKVCYYSITLSDASEMSKLFFENSIELLENDVIYSEEQLSQMNTEFIFICASLLSINVAKKNSNCLPILVSGLLSEPISDAIVVKSIQKIICLFDLNEDSAICRLMQFSTFDSVRNAILEPYLNVLQNLEEVYIFGAQRLGQKLNDYFTRAGIQVLGFIDNDINKQGKMFCGKQVISLKNLSDKKNAVIVTASTWYLYEMQEQLKGNGFVHYISFAVLSLFDFKKFPFEFTFEKLQEDLIANRLKYVSLYLNIAGDKSRQVLDNIIKFRLTLNPSFTKTVCDDITKEYFDDEIIKLHDNEVFVDGGGFDGDTSELFIKKTGRNYKKIYFFEPDNTLFLRARENLKSYDNIEFINKGLFSEEKVVRFNVTGNLDGNIDDNGSIEITVTSIDQAIKDKITFIKLDIEGSEEEALIGSSKHLRCQPAKIAIAAYHKARDIWRLPELIMSLNETYEFYIRHYSKSTLDTIVYAIPIV